MEGRSKYRETNIVADEAQFLEQETRDVEEVLAEFDLTDLQDFSEESDSSEHIYVPWEEVQAMLPQSTLNAPQDTQKVPTSPTRQRKIEKIAEATHTKEELEGFERIRQRVTERFNELQKNDEQIKIARTQLNLVARHLENTEKNMALIEAACKEHTEQAIDENGSQQHREIVAKLVNIRDQLDEVKTSLIDAKNKFKTKFDFHNDVLMQKITEQENYKEMSTKEKFSRSNKAAKNSLIHPVQVRKAKSQASKNKSKDAEEYRTLFMNMKSASIKVERTLRKAALEYPEVGIRLQLNNPGYKLFDTLQKAETAAKVSERPSSPGPKL